MNSLLGAGVVVFIVIWSVISAYCAACSVHEYGWNRKAFYHFLGTMALIVLFYISALIMLYVLSILFVMTKAAWT